MPKPINNLAKYIGRSIPLKAYLKALKADLVGLCYHVVSDIPLAHIAHYPYKTSVQFEQDIIYLRKHFNFVSYEDIRAYAYSRRKLKAKSVFLSFDDGFSECFSVVRPILLKYYLPCIFFVSTDFIDNKQMFYETKAALCVNHLKEHVLSDGQQVLDKVNAVAGRKLKSLEEFSDWMLGLDFSFAGVIEKICEALKIDTAGYLQKERPYLTAEEIKTLKADGFTIGAHSRSHANHDLLDREELESEIVESCQIIRNLLGVDYFPYAFPYNGIGIDRAYLKAIKEKYQFIDLFFDTQNFEKEDFVFNRVWADLPGRKNMLNSNLPLLLKDECMRYIHRSLFIHTCQG